MLFLLVLEIVSFYIKIGKAGCEDIYIICENSRTMFCIHAQSTSNLDHEAALINIQCLSRSSSHHYCRRRNHCTLYWSINSQCFYSTICQRVRPTCSYKIQSRSNCRTISCVYSISWWCRISTRQVDIEYCREMIPMSIQQLPSYKHKSDGPLEFEVTFDVIDCDLPLLIHCAQWKRALIFSTWSWVFGLEILVIGSR